MEDHSLHHHHKKRKNHTLLLVILFALIVVVFISIKGKGLSAYCPAKEVPCQVLLSKGEKSPYRSNIHAPYSGWHFAGFAEMKACWAGVKEFCSICDDTPENRNDACRKLFPGKMLRSSR